MTQEGMGSRNYLSRQLDEPAMVEFVHQILYHALEKDGEYWRSRGQR
jgi:hypothetical protein